jgi:hypothetical protein
MMKMGRWITVYSERTKLDLYFSDMLHSADWCLVTDVLEKHICPILQGTYFHPETSVTTNLRCVTSQKRSINCAEMSVNNYPSTLRYIPEEIDRLSRNVGN